MVGRRKEGKKYNYNLLILKNLKVFKITYTVIYKKEY